MPLTARWSLPSLPNRFIKTWSSRLPSLLRRLIKKSAAWSRVPQPSNKPCCYSCRCQALGCNWRRICWLSCRKLWILKSWRLSLAFVRSSMKVALRSLPLQLHGTTDHPSCANCFTWVPAQFELTKKQFQQYFFRKVAEGKHKKLVLNNIQNKILKLACAVVRSNQPYIPNYVSVNPLVFQKTLTHS